MKNNHNSYNYNRQIIQNNIVSLNDCFNYFQESLILKEIIKIFVIFAIKNQILYILLIFIQALKF